MESRKFLMEQNYATLFSLTNKIQMNGDQCFDFLTSRQMMALIAVLHLPGDQATLQNVANMLGNSKQSTKHIVAGLNNKGYISIEENHRDKRAIRIVLTGEGKEVLSSDAQKGYDFFEDLFHQFSNHDLETLWTLLRKLYRYDGKEQHGFEDAAQFK